MDGTSEFSSTLEAQKQELRTRLANDKAKQLRTRFEARGFGSISDYRKDPSGNDLISIGDLSDEELLRICVEYFEDLEKRGREFPDNLDEIKVNPTSQPAWEMTVKDFVDGYGQQYAYWIRRADAKHDTALQQEQIQIENNYVKFYNLFFNQVCAQNDLTEDGEVQGLINSRPKGIELEGVEEVLKLIHSKAVRKFAEKEKTKIDERFLQPILSHLHQIDLKHGRNVEAMLPELKALMPAGVEVFDIDAALCFRDPKTNLVYALLWTNNTIPKKWRDFFKAPQGDNYPVKEVVRPAVAYEQKSKSGNSSWALIRIGEVRQ